MYRYFFLEILLLQAFFFYGLFGRCGFRGVVGADTGHREWACLSSYRETEQITHSAAVLYRLTNLKEKVTSGDRILKKAWPSEAWSA